MPHFESIQVADFLAHRTHVLAHELNEALTIIGGYSDIIAQSLPRNDANRDSFAEIVRAVGRSAVIAEELLSLHP